MFLPARTTSSKRLSIAICPSARALVVALLAAASVAGIVGCDDAGAPVAPAPSAPAVERQGESPTAARTGSEPAELNPDRDRRFGDAGLRRIRHENEELFPRMEAWARAGVEDGISLHDEVAVILRPGDDIQAAIGASEGGVVLLEGGEYALRQALNVAPGVILRGSGRETVLVPAAGAPGVVMREAEGAGVESLRLRGGGVSLEGSSNCWLSDVAVEPGEDVAVHPIVVRRSEHCTLRGLDVAGSGSIVVDRSESLLLVGLRLRGLRSIVFRGPTRDSVVRSVVSGAGVHFERADEIRGLLFEDCHFLFRPGYPLPPFSKGAMPMGPRCLVMNCTAYHHGTDAISRQIIEPGRVYAIHRYETRDNALPGDDPQPRWIAPLRYKKNLEPRAPAAGPEEVAATWKEPPEGVKVVALRNRAPLDDWAWTTPIGGDEGAGADVTDLEVSRFLEEPLIAGTEREIAGETVSVDWTGRRKEPVFGEDIDPAHLQQMMGRFGWKGVPPVGEKVELLARAGGKWRGGLVLQRVVRIPGEPIVELETRTVGCRLKLFLGERLLEEGSQYRLEPGYDALTALVALERRTTLIRSASIEVVFTLREEPEPVERILDVPEPDLGWLYPFDAGKDPLAGEREALEAWTRYFEGTLREFPAPDRLDGAKSLRERYPGTHVAWLAEAVIEILSEAPFDEDAELAGLEWAQLADYYHRRGLPERKWAINRTKSPPRWREYYPERAGEVKR